MKFFAVLFALVAASAAASSQQPPAVRQAIEERVERLDATGELAIGEVWIAARRLIPVLYQRRDYAPAWSERDDVEDLFEALDAHGHRIDPETLDCDSCRLAYVSDGYCEDHRRGWIRGLAYLTPLTYYLARGERDLEDQPLPRRCSGRALS